MRIADLQGKVFNPQEAVVLCVVDTLDCYTSPGYDADRCGLPWSLNSPLGMEPLKRRQNEKKFGSWEVLASGGRRYWYEVKGRYGWTARYIKVVDPGETTVRFYQEIYNDRGNLVEVHHKYPVDIGHTSVESEEQP